MQLPGTVIVAPDTEALFEKLGDALLSRALASIEARGVFHLALSGGGTPEPFYVRLVTDLKFRLLPWAKTHVWIVDERQVPETDEKSNVRMLRESLLDHVITPAAQIHAMPVLEDDAAERYEAALREALQTPRSDGHLTTPNLDFVLLGMGGDCHTASLFPHSPALSVDDRLIVANAGEQVTPPARLTMTYPLLNSARELAVLVTGAGKHEALKRVEQQHRTGKVDIANLPITGLAPSRGSLTWYLDDPAAGLDGIQP